MGNLSPISTLVFIPHELELLMGQLYKDFYITLQCGRLVTHREMKEGADLFEFHTPPVGDIDQI